MAKVEEVFQAGPKQICDQEYDLILDRNTLLDKLGEAHIFQSLEVLNLAEKLGKLLVQGLSLHSKRLIRIMRIVCHVYFSEGTLTNFLNEAELLAYQRVFYRHILAIIRCFFFY